MNKGKPSHLFMQQTHRCIVNHSIKLKEQLPHIQVFRFLDDSYASLLRKTIIYNTSYAGKDIPEDGDMQRLMLYAGVDHVLHKVSWLFVFVSWFYVGFEMIKKHFLKHGAFFKNLKPCSKHTLISLTSHFKFAAFSLRHSRKRAG